MSNFIYISGKKRKKHINLINIPLNLPNEYKRIYTISYIFLIPYVIGSLVVFFYLYNANFEKFIALDFNKFFIFTWAIGAEISIISLLIYLFIKHLISKKNGSWNYQTLK